MSQEKKERDLWITPTPHKKELLDATALAIKQFFPESDFNARMKEQLRHSRLNKDKTEEEAASSTAASSASSKQHS